MRVFISIAVTFDKIVCFHLFVWKKFIFWGKICENILHFLDSALAAFEFKTRYMWWGYEKQ